MKGSYEITVSNAKIHYNFTVRRNITIIKGDSATGKTTLVDMIREYYEAGENSGIVLTCERNCRVLEGRDWRILLDTIEKTIIFIDEDNSFLPTDEFAKAVQKSDNYYVIVTREGLPNLPYSVEEIYGIRLLGKYGTLKQSYHEFYRIYGTDLLKNEVKPEMVITEDSNSGYQFFKTVCDGYGLKCDSANGKSNVFHCLNVSNDRSVLVIADGAAFGSEIDKVVQLLKERTNGVLYLPESFEWLLLSAGILRDREVADILSDPSEYVESKDYFSWERFFTALLIEKTQDTYLRYSKKELNQAYTKEPVKAQVLAKMNKIVLETAKSPQ